MKRNTVFIVGAGASSEFNLPLGTDLLKQVARSVDFYSDFETRRMRGSQQILEQAVYIYGNERGIQDKVWQAGRAIANGSVLTDSIDNFLDKHSENHFIQTVGKIAIVDAISKAEENSYLSPKRDRYLDPLNFEKIETTWIASLFRILQRNVSANDVDKFFEGSSFIIFNYDRCVEYFFWKALQSAYLIDHVAAAEIVRKMRVFHPYGTIAPLSLGEGRDGRHMEFGGKLSQPIRDLAKNIKIYTEQVEAGDALNEAHHWISEADTICFLGFSYQKQNMDLIFPAKTNNQPAVLGTRVGFSAHDTGIIEGDLKKRLQGNQAHISLADMKCFEFFSNFSKAFS